jgi:hypothetical protein
MPPSLIALVLQTAVTVFNLWLHRPQAVSKSEAAVPPATPSETQVFTTGLQ